jgi:hypothetical protein
LCNSEKKEQRCAQLETAVVDSVGQLCREPQFTNDKHFQKGKKKVPPPLPLSTGRHQPPRHQHYAAITTTTLPLPPPLPLHR